MFQSLNFSNLYIFEYPRFLSVLQVCVGDYTCVNEDELLADSSTKEVKEINRKSARGIWRQHLRLLLLRLRLRRRRLLLAK